MRMRLWKVFSSFEFRVTLLCLPDAPKKDCHRTAYIMPGVVDLGGLSGAAVLWQSHRPPERRRCCATRCWWLPRMDERSCGRHRTTLTLGRTGPWCLVENDPATILVTYYYIRDSLGSIPFPTTPSLLAKHRTRRSQLSCTCRSMPGRNFSYMWPWPTKGWSSLLIWMFEL